MASETRSGETLRLHRQPHSCKPAYSEGRRTVVHLYGGLPDLLTDLFAKLPDVSWHQTRCPSGAESATCVHSEVFDR